MCVVYIIWKAFFCITSHYGGIAYFNELCKWQLSSIFSKSLHNFEKLCNLQNEDQHKEGAEKDEQMVKVEQNNQENKKKTITVKVWKIFCNIQHSPFTVKPIWV